MTSAVQTAFNEQWDKPREMTGQVRRDLGITAVLDKLAGDGGLVSTRRWYAKHIIKISRGLITDVETANLVLTKLNGQPKLIGEIFAGSKAEFPGGKIMTLEGYVIGGPRTGSVSFGRGKRSTCYPVDFRIHALPEADAQDVEAAANILETKAEIALLELREGTDAQANLELLRLARRALLIAKDFFENEDVDDLISKLESFDLY